MPIQAPLEEHQVNSRRNRLGLSSNHPQAIKLAQEWVDLYDETRKRHLSKSEYASCLKTSLCLCADLISAAATQQTTWIGYSRGKANYVKGGSYWDEPNGTALLSRAYFLGIIECLSEAGLVDNIIAKPGHAFFSSRLRPTLLLSQLFKKMGLNWTHVSEDESAEIILVKDENKKLTTWPEPNGFDLVDAQNNLRLFNLNLAKTQINIRVPDEELANLNCPELENYEPEGGGHGTHSQIDFTNRRLRRVFAKSSFQMGGRFYGGWWQGVPGRLRKHIEINGWMTTELDYSTIQPRILYAAAGLQPPEDSYVLPGWDENLRTVAKKAFSKLLNSSPTSRNPNQWHRFAPDLAPDPLPLNWYDLTLSQKSSIRRQTFKKLTGREYNELISDLLDFHQPIAEDFFSSVWGKTQSIDARIVELVLCKMLELEQSEIVLPIHDSFIVRLGMEKNLLKAMEEAFFEVVGVGAVIDQDAPAFAPPEDYEGCELTYVLAYHEQGQDFEVTHAQYIERNDQWQATHGPQSNNDLLLHMVDDLAANVAGPWEPIIDPMAEKDD